MAEKEIIHNYLSPNKKIADLTNSKLGIIENFVQALENSIGGDYYSHLFSIYENIVDVSNLSPSIKTLIENNNALLDAYGEKIKQAEIVMQEDEAKIKSIYNELTEMEYSADISERLTEIKDSITSVFLTFDEANESIKDLDVRREEIKRHRETIKNCIANIKSDYQSLRALGELKIFKNSCKQQVLRQFFANASSSNSALNENLNNVFNTLWQKAEKENETLIKLANTAMKFAVKYQNRIEMVDDNTIADLNAELDNFENNGMELFTLSDDDLVSEFLDVDNL